MMEKKKNNSDIQDKDPGVLFIRYDKNTFCGQIIEKLKQESSYKLNRRVLKLIFLSEIVEPLNFLNVDLDILSEAYYESLKLFSDKFEQANYKITRLTAQITRQRNREAVSPLRGETEATNTLAFLPTNNLPSEDIKLPLAVQNIKSHS